MRNFSIKNGFRKRIVPILLTGVVVVGGLSGITAAAARRAGYGRQAGPGVSQQQPYGVAQCIVAEAAPLDQSDMELTLAGYGAKGALADEDLTVVDMLAYAIQDEYLAHAEYGAILAKYGNIRPYSNIDEAAQVGVQAEINNIVMYDKFLSQQLPSEVDNVFESLRDASESHLAAFTRQVERLTR